MIQHFLGIHHVVNKFQITDVPTDVILIARIDDSSVFDSCAMDS